MLSIHDAKKLQSFLSLLDSDAPDSELLALADEDLPSEPLVVDEEVLPLVPLPAHAARQHSIALHVLQGSLVFFLLFVFCFVLVCCALLGGASSTHVDLTRRFLVDNDVVVSFDNCVHSSGHQRAYIRCCAGRAQEACFKYTGPPTNQHPPPRGGTGGALQTSTHDQAHAVAWCAAWALRARGCAAAFTKVQHKAFEPEEAAVNSLLDKIQEIDA